MTVSVRYPQTVELEDGTLIQTDQCTWESRQLVAETDKSEVEIRGMLVKEGFGETVMENPKSGRIGRGMVKRFKDWQIHVRLFQNGDSIQIDGEVEVSKAYCEHLTHGWVPALMLCASMVKHHFGGVRIYHRGYQKYVAKTVREYVLRLRDPKSKTSVAVVVAAIVAVPVALCLAWAWRNKTKMS